jgi:4-hydroxy-3-polyprenylbenzoate decarboxylase
VAADDLRAFLRELAAAGELIEVSTPRDPGGPGQGRSSPGDERGDLAAVYPPPAGSLGRRVVGVYGSARRIALALRLPPDRPLSEQASAASRRLGSSIDAQYVAPSAAACKQVVLRGAAIDLRSLATLDQPPGQAPVLTRVLLATRDPDSGAIGLTPAALHVQEPSTATIDLWRGGPFARHLAVTAASGGPLEVAALLGNDPSLPLVALMPLSPDADAYLAASAVRDQPLVITDCESTDLEIPARGEIVLEGLVESAATGSGGAGAPLLKVHTMTHRRDPILEVQPDGDRGAEATLLAAWAAASQAAAESEGD